MGQELQAASGCVNRLRPVEVQLFVIGRRHVRGEIRAIEHVAAVAVGAANRLATWHPCAGERVRVTMGPLVAGLESI